jgi:hypothetical protein
MVAPNHHSNAEDCRLAVHSGDIGNMYANMIEFLSRRAIDCAGVALVGILTGVFLVAIFTNPILP